MESQGTTVMVQGRLVWCSGDLFKGKIKTEHNSNTPRVNPRTGEKMMEYGFGLAVPKSVLGQTAPGQPGEIWNVIHQEAYKLFPPPNQIPPGFAMKYKDGDTADEKGVPFAQRVDVKGVSTYAGHMVVACTTSLPIKFFKFDQASGQNVMVNDGIKSGDYVSVQLTVKAHAAIGQGKAGLYLNPNAVQFLGFGEAIINAPSGDQIFGKQAPPLPMGASAVPLAPQQGLLVPSQAMPQVAPVPHHAVLPQQFQPQQYQQPQPVQQAMPTIPGVPVPGVR